LTGEATPEVLGPVPGSPVQKAPKMIKQLDLLSYNKRLRAVTVQHGEEKAQEGTSSMCTNTWSG